MPSSPCWVCSTLAKAIGKISFGLAGCRVPGPPRLSYSTQIASSNCRKELSCHWHCSARCFPCPWPWVCLLQPPTWCWSVLTLWVNSVLRHCTLALQRSSPRARSQAHHLLSNSILLIIWSEASRNSHEKSQSSSVSWSHWPVWPHDYTRHPLTIITLKGSRDYASMSCKKY